MPKNENQSYKIPPDEFKNRKPSEVRTDSISINDAYNLFLRNESIIDIKDYCNRKTIVTNIEKEKYVKILFYLNNQKKKKNSIELNLENTSKEDENEFIKIKKEYTFGKNFNLLGSISDDDNLLLLNYIEENHDSENIFYIFDFNICQFVNSFKFHNIWISPILFSKMNNYKLFDKNSFIICDENLNIIQYFYDKNYANKIYYINISKPKEESDKKAIKIISLDNKIILLCYDSEYYILNN